MADKNVWDELNRLENQDELDTQAAARAKDRELQQRNLRNMTARQVVQKRENMRLSQKAQQELDGDVWDILPEQQKIEQLRKDKAELNEQRLLATDLAVDMAFNEPENIDLAKVTSLTGIPITPERMMDIGRPKTATLGILSDQDREENRFDNEWRTSIFTNIFDHRNNQSPVDGQSPFPLYTGYAADGSTIDEAKARDYMKIAQQSDSGGEGSSFKYLDVRSQTEREIPYFELFKEYPHIFNLPYIKSFEMGDTASNPDMNPELIKYLSDTASNDHSFVANNPNVWQDFYSANPALDDETSEDYKKRMLTKYNIDNSGNNKVLKDNPYYGWKPEDVFQDFAQWLTTESPDAKNRYTGEYTFQGTAQEIFDQMYARDEIAPKGQRDMHFYENYRGGGKGFILDDRRDIVGEHGTIFYKEWAAMVEDEDLTYDDFNPYRQIQGDKWYPYMTEDQYTMWEGIKDGFFNQYGTAGDRWLNATHRGVGLGTEKIGQLVGVMNSWSDYLEKVTEGDIRQDDAFGALSQWLMEKGYQVKTGQTMLGDGTTFEGSKSLNDFKGSDFMEFVDAIPGLAIDLYLLKGLASRTGAASLPIWVGTQRGAEAIEKGREEIIDEETGEILGQALSTDSADILWSTLKGYGEGYTYHLVFKGTSMIQNPVGRTITGGTVFGGPAMYKAIKDEYDGDPNTDGNFADAYANFVFGGAMSYFARGNKYSDLAPWQAKLLRTFLRPQVGRGNFRIPLSKSEKLAINVYNNGRVVDHPQLGKVKIYADKNGRVVYKSTKDGDWYLIDKNGKPSKSSEPEFGEYFNRSILTEKGFQDWMKSLSKKELAAILNGKTQGIPVTLKDKIVMKLLQRFNMPQGFEMVKWTAGSGRGGVKPTTKSIPLGDTNIAPTSTNLNKTNTPTTPPTPSVVQPTGGAAVSISTPKVSTQSSSAQTAKPLADKDFPDIDRISSSVISLQKTPSQEVYDNTVNEIANVSSQLDAGYVYQSGKMVPISKGDAVKMRQRLIELENEASKAMTPEANRVAPLKTPEQIKFDNAVSKLNAPINPKTNKPYVNYKTPIKNPNQAIKRYEKVQKDADALRLRRDGLKPDSVSYKNVDNKISQLNKYGDDLKSVIKQSNPDYFKPSKVPTTKTVAPKTTAPSTKTNQTVGKPSRIDTELPDLIKNRYGKNDKALQARLERDYEVESVDQLSPEQKADFHSNLTVEEISRGFEAGFLGMTPQNMKLLRQGIIDAGRFTYKNLPKSMQKQADKIGVTAENFKQQFRDWTKDPKKAPQKTKAFFKKVWQQLKNWWKKGKEGFKDYLKNPKIGASIEMVNKKGKPLTVKEQAEALKGKIKTKAPATKGRTGYGMNKRIPQSQRATGITTPKTLESGESFKLTKSSGRGRKQSIPQEKLDNMLAESLAEANTQKIPSSIKAPSTKEVENFTSGKNEDRFWYEHSSDAFTNKVQLGNKKDKSKLHGLVAATSVNEKPLPNLVKAISALSEHMQGSPIYTSLIDPKPIQDVLRGDSFESPKIGNFQQTFDYITGITNQKPLTVNDRQVAARYGIKPSDLATNPSLYEAISRNEIKLANELNKDIRTGEEPWTEYQLQAASWTNTRYDKGVSQIGDNYSQAFEKVFDVLEANGIKLPRTKDGQRYLNDEVMRNPNLPKILSPAGYKYKQSLKGNIEFATTNTIEGKIAQDNFAEIAKALGMTIDMQTAKQLTKMQQLYIETYKRALKKLGQQPDYKPSILNRMIDGIVGKRFKLSRVTYDTGGWGGVVNQNITFPLSESQATGSRGQIELNDIQAEGLLSILAKYAKQEAGGGSRFKRIEGENAWEKAEAFQIFTPEKGISIQKEQMLLGAIKKHTGQSLGFNKQELPNGTIYSFHPDGKLPTPEALAKAGEQIFREGVEVMPAEYKSILALDKQYNENIRRMKNGIAEEIAIQARDRIAGSGAKPPTVGQIITAIKGRKPIESYLKNQTGKSLGYIQKARSSYKSRMDILNNAIKDYKVITKQLDKELGILNKNLQEPINKINGRKLNKYEEILGDGFEAGFLGFTPQNFKLLKQGLIDTGTFLFRDLPKHLQKLAKALKIGAANFTHALDKFMYYFGPVTVGKRVIPKGYNKLKDFWKQVYNSMKSWWTKNKGRVVNDVKVKDIQRTADARSKKISQKDLAYQTQKKLAIAKIIEKDLIAAKVTTEGQLRALKKDVLGVSSLGDLNKKGHPTDPEADMKISGYIRLLRRFENRKRGVDVSKMIPAADHYPMPTQRDPKEVLQIETGDLSLRRTVLNHRTYELDDPGLIKDADQRSPLGFISEGATGRFIRNFGNTEDFTDLIQQKTGAPVYDAFEDVRIAIGNVEGYTEKWIVPLVEMIKKATGKIDIDKALTLSSRVKIHRAGKGDQDALDNLTQLESDILNHIKSYYNDPHIQKIFKLNRFMQWYNTAGTSNKGIPGVEKADLLDLKHIYETQGANALLSAIDDVQGFIIDSNYMPDFTEVVNYNNSSAMYNLNVGKKILKPKDSNSDMNKDAVKSFLRKVRADAKIYYMDTPITRMVNIVNTGLPAEVANDMLLVIDSLNRPMDTSSLAEMNSKWVGWVMKAALSLPEKWTRNMFQRLTLLPYEPVTNMPRMFGQMMKNTFLPQKIGGVPAPGRGGLNITKSSEYINAPEWKKAHFNKLVSANASLAEDFLMSTHMPILDKLPFGLNTACRAWIDVYKWTDASNRWAIFNPMTNNILKTLEDAAITGKDFNAIRKHLYWDKLSDYESLRDILRPEINEALKGNVAAQRYVALRIAEHMSGPAVNWRYNRPDRSVHENSSALGRALFRATTYPVRLLAQLAKDAWKVYRGAYRRNPREMWAGLKGVAGRLAIMFGVEKALTWLFGEKDSGYGWGYDIFEIINFEVGGLGFVGADWLYGTYGAVGKYKEAFDAYMGGDEDYGDELLEDATQQLASYTDNITKQTVVFYRFFTRQLEVALGVKKVAPLRDLVDVWIGQYDPEELDRTMEQMIQRAVAGGGGEPEEDDDGKRWIDEFRNMPEFQMNPY